MVQTSFMVVTVLLGVTSCSEFHSSIHSFFVCVVENSFGMNLKS